LFHKFSKQLTAADSPVVICHLVITSDVNYNVKVFDSYRLVLKNIRYPFKLCHLNFLVIVQQYESFTLFANYCLLEQLGNIGEFNSCLGNVSGKSCKKTTYY